MTEFPPREGPLGLLDGFFLRMRFFLNRRNIDAARRLARSTTTGRELRPVLSIYARAIAANTNAISDLVFFIERFEQATGLKAHKVLGLAPGEEMEEEGKLALATLRVVARAMHRGDREALEKGPDLAAFLAGREMGPEELSRWLTSF